MCGHLHPREWYNESKFLQFDPWKLRFTHDKVSPKFRAGGTIDETIDRIRSEQMSFDDFPPMEVFRLTKAALDDDTIVRSVLTRFDIAEDSQQASKLIARLRASAGEMLSLSNRRLFVARVLRTLGLVDKVPIQEYDFSSERVQRPERKDDDEADKAKWLSALSTESMGWKVHVHSGYHGFEEPGQAVHSFELPEATSEDAAMSAKRTVRSRVSARLGMEHVTCHVHKDAEEGFSIDVCVPPDFLAEVQSIEVPVGKAGIRKTGKDVKRKNPKQEILDFLASQSGHTFKGGRGKGKGKGKAGSKGAKVG